MSVDREQIRRELARFPGPLQPNIWTLHARAVALLAALEQAERERDVWKNKAFDALSLSRKANDNCEWMDGQLAAVPALVEQAERERDEARKAANEWHRLYRAVASSRDDLMDSTRDALAAVEQAQEQR